MKTSHLKIGIWIDHRQAVIISASGFGHDSSDEPDHTEPYQVIESNADRQPGRASGRKFTGSYEDRLVPDDDTKDRRFEHQLNEYYDEVADHVHEATQLFVCGPGEAKGEFVKRLQLQYPSQREIQVETSDKLTNPQIVAKVNDHFRLALHS